MSDSRGVTSSVHGYLSRAGWVQQEPGVAGALWTLTQPAAGMYGENENLPTLAVPSTISLGSTELRGLTERLAAYEQRKSEQVASEIEHFYIDVMRFRAANDYVISGTIPLTAGVDLVHSAYSMMRASATTACQPKSHIAGGFSLLGDKIIEDARLGQTEEGSYIVPVLLPLTEPAAEEQVDLWGDEPGTVERVALEPPERRVTRTLAQALTAVERLVVDPAREPQTSVIAPLVAAGASRELIVAAKRVLEDPAVAVFEAAFDWAGAAPAPASVPKSVIFPQAANPLLERASRLLRASRRDPWVQMTGPIVEVRHVPNDPFGSVVLQTVRRGRPVEVRVALSAAKLDPVHDWMCTSRTIVVAGQVQRDPGKRLRIDAPTALYPLDETFLPIEETAKP